MLRTLLESNAQPQRRRASTVVSIAVHAAAIAGAIAATTASARTDAARWEERARERPPVFVPLAQSDRPLGKASPSRLVPEPDHALVDRRPQLPRTPVFAPLWVGSPLADLDPGALLAADTAIPGRQVYVGRRPGGQGVAPALGDEPVTAAHVDRPAILLAPPRPRYPDQLRAAGVTGRVVARFVVDTAGRVEKASVVIREANHDLFAAAVRAVLPSLRFTPAVAGGRKVRMLVDLPFEFRLKD